MEYLIVFLEGIVTFISPCLLPMLPLYISYFAGGEVTETGHKVLYNALGFVFGFTLVFVALGAFAGTLGQFIFEHGTVFNLFSGLIIVILKSTFDFLKKHYKIINYVSGVLLILLGILMMAGRLL